MATYIPYTLQEMINDSALSARVKERIAYLVNNHHVAIEARNDGGTFVAYAGRVALTYKAVLFIRVCPGCSGGMNVAFEKGKVGDDYLVKVAETLTRFSYLTKGL